MTISPQLAVYIAAGTTLAVLFTLAVARVVRDSAEDGGDERPNGDWPKVPFVCTQGCNCNPVLPGLGASQGTDRDDCGGGNRVPAAIVDQPPHSQPIGRKGHQDHA